MNALADLDSLRKNLKNAGINEVAAMGAGEIGDKFASGSMAGGPGSVDYWLHKGSHAALGCATASAKGGDCASGASGAVIGEAVGEVVGKGLIQDGEFSETDKTHVKIIGTTAAIYGTSATGGNINDVADTSQNAIDNNLEGTLTGCVIGGPGGCAVGVVIDAGKLIVAGAVISATACAANPDCRKIVQNMIDSGKELAQDFLAAMNSYSENLNSSAEQPGNENQETDGEQSKVERKKEIAGGTASPMPNGPEDDKSIF